MPPSIPSPPTPWASTASSSSSMRPTAAAGARPGARRRWVSGRWHATARAKWILFRQAGDEPAGQRARRRCGASPVLPRAGHFGCAFKVRDAGARRTTGAWSSVPGGSPLPPPAMELNIPRSTAPAAAASTRGWPTGSSPSTTSTSCPFRRSIPDRRRSPDAIFGVVQYDRAEPEQRLDRLLRGDVRLPASPTTSASESCRPASCCESPCDRFMWQLVEPLPARRDGCRRRVLARVGLGVADVRRR